MGRISKDTSGFIKAVAMLMVVTAHYAQWYASRTDAGMAVMMLGKLGRYGVAMFFAISGYGLVSSAARGLDVSFFKKRLLNVYFPYLIITFFTTALAGIVTDSGWGGLKDICSWLTGFDAWFIFVIMLLYIIFYFVWKYSRHKIIVMTAAVAVLSLLLALFVKNDVWYSSNFSFLVGICCKVYEDRLAELLSKKGLGCCAALAVGFICCAVVYMVMSGKIFGIYIICKVLASVFWALLCMCVFFMREPAWAFGLHIHKLGRFSLECYLLHRFALHLVENLPYGPVPILLAALALTLICAAAVNWLFNRVRRSLSRLS